MFTVELGFEGYIWDCWQGTY